MHFVFVFNAFYYYYYTIYLTLLAIFIHLLFGTLSYYCKKSSIDDARHTLKHMEQWNTELLSNLVSNQILSTKVQSSLKQ